MRKLFGLVIVGLALLLSLNVATAEASDGLRLAPSKTQIKLADGQRYDGIFRVMNVGATPMKFRVYATPFSIDGDSYDQPNYDRETARTQMASWISFPKDEFTVEKDQSVEVEYQISAPDNPPAGSQYATIFAQTVSSQPDENGVVTEVRLPMLIYARMSGETIEKGHIAGREIKFWYTSTISTSVKIKNDGNVDFMPTVKLRISNWFDGKTVYEANANSSAVLPDTTRRFEFNWQEEDEVTQAGPPLFGLFWVEETTTIFGQVNTVRNLVLIMPLWLIATAAAVLIFGVFLIMRRHRNRKLRRARTTRRVFARNLAKKTLRKTAVNDTIDTESEK